MSATVQERLSEYILLPREVRKAHIDLSTPCILNGGASGGRSRRGRKALLALLGVENDFPNWRTAKIQLCHACDCHSKNGYCENPLHLSIGTAKENISDIPLEVLQENGRKWGKRALELKTGIHDPTVREESDRQMRKAIEVTRVDTGETTVFEGLGVAARVLGLDVRALSAVCLGKRPQHKGYSARYIQCTNGAAPQY